MIESVVGPKTYGVWIDMLKNLVPGGRTHRLSVVIAGMLKYSEKMAYEKRNQNTNADKLDQIFQKIYENYEDESFAAILDLAESLMIDAQVNYERVNSKGRKFSIAESAVQEFIRWDFMPWE